MKRLITGLFALLSLSAFADCQVNIDRVISQHIGGQKRFKQILTNKGYEIVTDPSAGLVVLANYRFADRIGGAKLKLALYLDEGDKRISSAEYTVYEPIGMNLFERRALLHFADSLPVCE